MARLNRNKENRTEKKKETNWLLILNLLMTVGLYLLHFIGK